MHGQFQYSETLHRPPIESVCKEPDYYHEEEEIQLEFHLTYEGLLLGASKTDTRAKHKHEIRRAFHPQLKRLWAVTPHLSKMRDQLAAGPVTVQGGGYRRREEALPERYQSGDFRFVPLVTKDMEFTCSLEILFLRPEPRGRVIKSGDLDNRIKTLFDALRIPDRTGQEMRGCVPVEGEGPLYCLLEDDSQITKVSIETDMLLKPINGAEFSESNKNDARLIIQVAIRPTNANWGTLDFLG